MLKVCVIGCGGIGGYHLSHLVQYTDLIELVGFCDLVLSRAEGFVEKAGSGKAYTNYTKMLDEQKPDAVFVCIPPISHGEGFIELELVERGIPFFVEKPVTLNLFIARRIRDAVAAKNLITAVGFQLRYDNLVDTVKAYMKENRIGTMNVTRIGGIPGVWWWLDKAACGGQIVEQTIHQLDMMRYVYGEPESVFTYNARGFIENPPAGYKTDDYSATVVRFTSGALATITTGCFATAGASADNKMTFNGIDSRLDFYPAQKALIYGKTPAAAGGEVKGTQSIVSYDNAMKSADGALEYKCDVDYGLVCDRTFLEAVASGDGSKVRSPYADAVKTLAFTLACNESMDTGRAAKVDFT
ncbi:MAG: Gfo/Idh/MocA family oxidoreductase [Clostridiaceae bacterium]|nr:Gfo/Idh/MocA family oxidoreductase [Clostridiaceae bacterium]